ncbi:hypothetical protein JCM3765_000942 [Sporobolomyces pararoseus]
MRLSRLLPALSAFVLAPHVLASTASSDTSSSSFLSSEQLANVQGSENHAYQSDIARLLKVVVSHLYNDKDVFVRELLSNANDAVEKLRFISLTDENVLATSNAQDLNVTVLVDKPQRRIIIRDSGIGMTKEQLSKNLGTIARSGTSEFVQQLESTSKNNSSASLIGQFGLGFYSSFLVASRVTVASKSYEPDSKQFVFESEADAEGFKIYEDPRGDTLGRGTEITLWLKDGEQELEEFLDEGKLRELIQRHASFNSAPIYLWEGEEAVVDSKPTNDEVENGDGVGDAEKGGWKLVNDQAPLWMRDPKDVTEEEYESFYLKTYKDPKPPTAHAHFTGDIGSTTFKSLIYLPAAVPTDFYSKDYVSLESLKLFVRRVFITSDLGKDYLPRWINWVKVFVDVEDLPLNVGRDSLQKTKSLGRIKKNLIKRIYDLLIKVSEEEPSKYEELYKSGAGTALKIGAVEEKDPKSKDKLLKHLRFESSASEDLTSLDEVVARRKEKQEQIYFVSGSGQTKKDLEKSPFVERILARGYEVLYFTEPIDEMLASGVGLYKNMKFVDCAKEGVKFGDEEEDDNDEESLKETFKPLVDFLQKELAAEVDKVDISTRLVSSPCLVTASTYGYSGNMLKLLAAQNSAAGGSDNFMLNFAKQQKKNFELNAKHPLIERLLEKVEDAEHDQDAEKELKETIQVLWQTALLKSSYTIPDPSQYFSQIETILRRSLGVSESAQAKIDVKPAPSIATSPLEASDMPPLFDQQEQQAEGGGASSWADWKDVKEKVKNVGEKVGKVLPDLSDDAGHEEVLHEEL